MRFEVIVDGVRKRVEVEAADPAAAAVLAAIAGAADGQTARTSQSAEVADVAPVTPDVSDDVPSPEVRERGPGFDVRGGVGDAGVAPAVSAAGGAKGEVRSTIDGAVLTLKVAEGDRVRTGDPLVLIEAMKVESLVQAPADGVVRELAIAPGDFVDAGQVLMRITMA